MQIHNDIIQGSPEWFEIRKGKLTASNGQAIASAGKGLETLVYEILAEKYSCAPQESYTNEDIERGKLMEEQARQMYELEKDVKIAQIGFIELDELTGASPDGQIIGQNGGIEIKCKNDTVYIRSLIEAKIDSKYLWQVQMQLLVSGWDYIDFIDYNPNFKKTMNITRIKPDKEMQEKLKIGIEEGKKLLIEKETIFKKLI